MRTLYTEFVGEHDAIRVWSNRPDETMTARRVVYIPGDGGSPFVSTHSREQLPLFGAFFANVDDAVLWVMRR